jgi:sodium-dependent dicarboxylate transporter 2/3/5
VAQQFGMNARAMAPLVAVPAGIAFMLPVGTPANAIAFSSGYMRLTDMLWPGLALNIVAYILFNLLVFYYWPLVGVHI